MPELFIGSNGLSLWSSRDLGQTLERLSTGAGMYSGSQVWALSAHPLNERDLFIGTDTGIYVLDRKTRKCRHVPSPMDEMLVTCLRHSHEDSQTVYAGAQPGALFKSTDGGAHWVKLDIPIEPYITAGFPEWDMHASDPSGIEVRHWTRVTDILVDPRGSDQVLAGVEINGAWRSADAGATWQPASSGLASQDIHGFCFLKDVQGSGGSVFATTNRGLHVSSDFGSSWSLQKIDSPWQYCRAVVPRQDGTGVMFLTNGDGPPGSTGFLFRSTDRGATWQRRPLPTQIDSSVYWAAVHPSNAALIFVATNLGQLFRSDDGGETWLALKRRLGEVRTLMWLPDCG